MPNKTNSELVESYLKANPQVKKALKVFNLSHAQYKQAIQAQTISPVIISTQTAPEKHNGKLG